MKLAMVVSILALAAAPGALGAQAVPRHTRPAYRRAVPARLLRQASVTEDSALKVAQAHVPAGTAEALELENENHHLIWSFEFKVPNRPGIYEVNVDAKTGNIVGKVEHEAPETERRPGAPAVPGSPA